jgi:hypothetical protein
MSALRQQWMTVAAALALFPAFTSARAAERVLPAACENLQGFWVSKSFFNAEKDGSAGGIEKYRANSFSHQAAIFVVTRSGEFWLHLMGGQTAYLDGGADVASDGGPAVFWKKSVLFWQRSSNEDRKPAFIEKCDGASVTIFGNRISRFTRPSPDTLTMEMPDFGAYAAPPGEVPPMLAINFERVSP